MRSQTNGHVRRKTDTVARVCACVFSCCSPSLAVSTVRAAVCFCPRCFACWLKHLSRMNRFSNEKTIFALILVRILVAIKEFCLVRDMLLLLLLFVALII